MTTASTIVCPVCSNPVAASMTTYGVRHSCCGLWSWGGKPLVDAATHDARKKAHEAFDVLWKSGKMSRQAAYKSLAKCLGVEEREAHMSVMTKDIADRVSQAVKQIGDKQ